jgi:hypothetical protein
MEMFTYDMHAISPENQQTVYELVESIQALGLRNQACDPDSLLDVWDECIQHLDDNGIREAKPVVVPCAAWLLLKSHTLLDEQVVSSLLTFSKKLYCVERSFRDPAEFQSAIQLVLLAAQALPESHATVVKSYLNVIFAAF